MRLDSRELAEWEAFERANGPIDHKYTNEMLAQILDQFKLANWFTGMKWEDNPVPEPDRTERPEELYKLKDPIEVEDPEPDPDEVSEEEFAKLFEQQDD